jgi:DNA-damage-inducible protein D
MKLLPAQFEDHAIRRVYDEETETWWFSVVDIVQVLTQQPDFQTARKYWNKLKERLGNEGSQLVTNRHRFKLSAALKKSLLHPAFSGSCKEPNHDDSAGHFRDP